MTRPLFYGLLPPIAVLLALAGAFAAGRYTAHPPTRDVVRTEIQYRDRVQTQVVHDVQTVHDVEVQQHVVTQWRTGPDKVTTVTQYVDREQKAQTRAQGHTQAQQQRETEAQQTVVELHTVEARPAWSVSLLAGGQLGGRRLFEALPAPLVVGVAIERRILGPVSAGLWATSGMAGGLSLRVDF